MAVAGLLQFTPGLGIYSNHTSDKHHKCSFRSVKLHLSANNLSWLTSGQDLFTLHLSESLKRPVRPIPLRHNALHCCSSLLSGSNITSSCMNTVTTTLKSPSIIKLVTAAGIVVFALWGVGPLLRRSRNFFLHCFLSGTIYAGVVLNCTLFYIHMGEQKNDNNWKKSTTHYVLTSYLQPALLWTGAMFVCRALDPAVMPTEASHLVKQRILTFVRSLSTVLSFAYCFSCAIQQAQKFFMQTSDPSNTRNMSFQFAGKAVYTAVWVAAISLFMELLGFSTQKCLTAGGLGTVLLTLAGREIFTNFLSSAMIHATRPFVLNEWIQTKIEGYEVSGTVEHVGWWSPTIIRGEDREAVHIPNHKFTVNIVRNLSQKTHWRIKTHLAISHLDVKKINDIVADMRKVLAKNPQVEQQKLHRRVFLENVDPENQALLILISCFVKTSHHEEYFCVKEAILLDLLRVISHHGARLATPIRSFQRINSDVDMENIPFSRSGATSDRPFLLIEPSCKVNGEDKVKPSRPAQSGGDQDSQGSVHQSTSVSTSISDKDSKVANTVIKSAAATNSDKKSGQVEALQSSKVDSSNYLLECSSENSSEHPSASPQPKQGEKPPATQPALEENIVLEVALEGSKRTLPIDDDHPGTPPPVEAKEAATNRSSSGNGRGTAASAEDVKD